MKHLLNGINRMIPFVMVGAICSALAGRVAPDTALASFLQVLGNEGGLALMLPVLAGFIAHSIAGWDGLLAGMLGGLMASRGGSGMLGALAAGFLAGYMVLGLQKVIRLPAVLQDLLPILIYPALSGVGIAVLMLYVVNPPASWLMTSMQGWLAGMQGQSALLMGAVLGAMAAVDMGGPINKAASLFALDLLASGNAYPLGAVIGGVIVPAFGVCLSMRLAPRRYTEEELRLGKTTFLMGLINVIEGTIPIAAADPRRVIPAITLGGAVSGAICMMTGVAVRMPVGGIITPIIPGMVTNLPAYAIAVAVGTLVTASVLVVWKPVRRG
ncbi:MAG: system, fructose subfamily, subunit [Symbiobacteriaceae bacterium]|jgi:PTS system fructose-specific IIC component|nr:system, fructose subfamily, subunit [Symbiobacteriaceae bacterium]